MQCKKQYLSECMTEICNQMNLLYNIFVDERIHKLAIEEKVQLNQLTAH